MPTAVAGFFSGMSIVLQEAVLPNLWWIAPLGVRAGILLPDLAVRQISGGG